MNCPHGYTNRKACSLCVSADDDAEIARLRAGRDEWRAAHLDACDARDALAARLAAIAEEADGRGDGAPDSHESERAWNRVEGLADLSDDMTIRFYAHLSPAPDEPPAAEPCGTCKGRRRVLPKTTVHPRFLTHLECDYTDPCPDCGEGEGVDGE